MFNELGATNWKGYLSVSNCFEKSNSFKEFLNTYIKNIIFSSRNGRVN